MHSFWGDGKISLQQQLKKKERKKEKNSAHYMHPLLTDQSMSCRIDKKFSIKLAGCEKH
jgi:hypothetical protein